MLIHKTKAKKLSNILLYGLGFSFNECRDFMKNICPTHPKYLFKSIGCTPENYVMYPRYFDCTLHYKGIRVRSLNLHHKYLKKKKKMNGIYTSLYEYKDNKQPSLRSIINKRKRTI